MNKIILLLILLFLNVEVVNADNLLVNNGYVNHLNHVYYLQSDNNDYYGFILTSSGMSQQVYNGQMIYIDDSFGSITSLKLYIQRTISNNSLPSGNLTIKVYKSVDNTQSSSKYLVDTFLVTPSSTSVQSFLLSLDYPIDIYDAGNNKLVNWLWFTVEGQNPLGLDDICQCGIQNVNEVIIGYWSQAGNDKYPYGSIWESGLFYSTWSIRDNKFTQENIYNDLAFQLFGTFYYPSTPEPTPIDSPPSNDSESPPCYECNGTIPEISDSGDSFTPDFNGSSLPVLCSENETGCLPEQTAPDSSIPSNTTAGTFLMSLGYCDSLSCGVQDIIDLLYDWSIIAFLMSLLYLIMMTKRFN